MGPRMDVTKQRTPSGWELAALAPAWLAVAWLVSRAQWFWSHRPDLQFGWAVLFLSGFLIYDGWERRPAARFRLGPATLLTLGAGLALLFVTQIYTAAFGMMAAAINALAAGILLVVAANLHYVFGFAGWRHFAFPFLFLLIALPMPSAIHGPIVNGLQAKVAMVNVEVLNLAGIPARRVGSLIHLPNGTVGVDEACSGIRSIQSTVMATLFIGYLTLKNLSMRVVLLVAGIGLAIFGNLVRSLYLSLTANSQGTQAVDKVHDGAGWGILIFTAAGVALTAWVFAKWEKEAAHALARDSQTSEDGNFAA